MFYTMKRQNKYVKIFSLLLAVIISVQYFSLVAEAADKDESVYGVAISNIDEIKGAKRKELSQGVKNSILRARQMADIEWTAQGSFDAYYTETLRFIEGIRYRGIPYGQPVHKGHYVGFNASLSDFAAAVDDGSSLMYSDKGENTYSYEYEGGSIKYSPYYSNDCSAYISYIWDLSGRFTTSMIAEQTISEGQAGYEEAKFQSVGRKIEDLEVGYALNKGGSHVILVYDIVYNRSGDIIQVTTLEQTPPIMRYRIWGVGGNYGSLTDLQNMIDGSGYDIIRYTGIENVKYDENPYIKLETPKIVNNISEPVSSTAYDDCAHGEAFVEKGKYTIEGWTSNDEKVKGVKYSVDGAEWKNADIEEYAGVIRFKAEAEFSGDYAQIVSVKGVTSEREYLIGEFTVNNIPEDYEYIVCFENFDGYNPGTTRNEIVEIKSKLGEPSESTIAFNGWSMCTKRVLGFEYKIDDGLWTTLETDFRGDAYKHFPEFENSNAFNSFTGGTGLGNLEGDMEHTLYVRCVTEGNDVYEIGRAVFSLEKETKTIFGIQMSEDLFNIILICGVVLLIIIIAVIVILVIKKIKNKKKAVKSNSKNEKE